MTLGYARLDQPPVMERFGDAQFLVFSNRIIALSLVGLYLFVKRRKYVLINRVMSTMLTSSISGCHLTYAIRFILNQTRLGTSAIHTLFCIDLKYAVLLVSIWSAKICKLPCSNGVQGIQSCPNNAHGKTVKKRKKTNVWLPHGFLPSIRGRPFPLFFTARREELEF